MFNDLSNEKEQKWFLILSAISFFPFYIFSFANNLGYGISAYKISFVIVFMFLFFLNGMKSIRLLTSYFICSLPIINFSKGSFFTYNIIVLLLGIIVLKLLLVNSSYFFSKRKNAFLVFFAFSLFYYLFSVLNTNHYRDNLRIFEMIFMAILVPLLYCDKKLFVKTVYLLGLNSIIFVQLATTFGAGRLMVDTEEIAESGLEIGGSNPISYGLPIAFCIIIFLVNFRTYKIIPEYLFYFFIFCLGGSLLLTTSRGSVLAVTISLLFYLLVKKKFAIFFYSLIFLIISYYLFGYLATIDKNFEFAYQFLIDRSFSDEMDVNKISHGRTEQWSSTFTYAKDHIPSFLLGFGPGMQFDAHQIISQSLAGQSDAHFVGARLAFHALPLQLIAEIGLFGCVLYYFLAWQIASKSIKLSKVQPLFFIGFLAWFSSGLSISSFDPFSGLFLGLSFIPFFINRENYVKF
jgi:hypothetical protein